MAYPQHRADEDRNDRRGQDRQCCRPRVSTGQARAPERPRSNEDELADQHDPTVGECLEPAPAAIGGDGPADAARIAFAWSSLADGPGSLTSGAAVQLYGRLRARIDSFDMAGVRRSVPPDARPYVVTGDRYINEWLGIEVVKPAGFRFAELDETWPSRTILAFENGTERVRLLARPRAPWAAPAVRPSEIINGSEVWVIEVESVNPDSLLRVARGAIRFRR